MQERGLRNVRRPQTPTWCCCLTLTSRSPPRVSMTARPPWKTSGSLRATVWTRASSYAGRSQRVERVWIPGPGTSGWGLVVDSVKAAEVSLTHLPVSRGLSCNCLPTYSVSDQSQASKDGPHAERVKSVGWTSWLNQFMKQTCSCYCSRSMIYPTRHTTLLWRWINVTDVDSTSQQHRVSSEIGVKNYLNNCLDN